MPQIDWDKLFVFTVSPYELFIRGTIVYISVFILMRVFGANQARSELRICLWLS